MNELKRRISALYEELKKLTGNLNLPQKREKINELESLMQEAGFWQDNERAQKISQEHSSLQEFFVFWSKILNDTEEILGVIETNTDETDETLKYLDEQVGLLEKKYQENRFVLLMSKKYDDHNAVLAIHAGAGGVDAQDWADMVFRMIMRFSEKKGFKTNVIDLSRGEQGGVKSVTIEISGPFAYGTLKSEAGVHRLVRLSPFNPAHTRETSFALIEIIPLLEDKETTVLDLKDLNIEATTSSGHGGQSVNTTYSAIRITHIPTGIKVSIQNERSQHQNKEIALKILTAKVQALEEERLAKEKKELRGEFKSAEWGNQIRSYVLHPYKMVKDHRTGIESTDPESVLDGKIDEFVEGYLEMGVTSSSSRA